MNILFIEDERDLRESGVAQLEFHNYTVYPVSNLAEAREILENPSMPVHLVIADHNLPDGEGVQFVIEIKDQYPDCSFMVASGCLTSSNTKLLDESEIPYFHKPLLYGKIVDKFRRAHLMSAPCSTVASEASQASEVLSEVPADRVIEEVTDPTAESQPPKRKKWFGLF
jgi:DNA-binding NtrC family response regulator